MTPPREAANVIRIDAGNQANVTSSTVSRGAVMAIAALLLGGGGAVGGSLIASPAPQVAALRSVADDCAKRVAALEEDRLRAASERAAMLEALRQIDGRVGRVQSLLERHIESADRRGGR